MIKKKQKFLTIFLSSIFIFNFTMFTRVMATEKNSEEKVEVKNINPKVKILEELGDGFSLTKSVNIIGEDTADREAVKFLKEILETNGIGVSETFDRNNTTIVLGEVSGEHADQEVIDIVTLLNKNKDEALNQRDGYILHSSNDYEEAENGVIVIAGKEEDGTYYGITSFKQILHGGEKVKIPEVYISDYSSIEFRGIVEAFDGEQWSHEDRKSLLEFSGDYKMNSYIYGPKDDPYHRDKWREAYPKEEAKKIKELAKVASENNVDFVWAVNLGEIITFTEQDYNDLLNKCNLMYDLGVRAFAIFFDDINGTVADANKQVEILNKLDEDLVKGKEDVAPLIMCSTEYNKLLQNPNFGTYLDILGEKLNQDIQIMWTGNKVMADINKASLEWVNNRVKREVCVWWNFPNNDCCRDRLLLGEAYELYNDVDNALGFLSTPMNQAQASKFALYNVANYSWNVEDFNSSDSWNKAIEALVPEVQKDFKVFAMHNADAYTDYHQYRRKESEHIKPLIEEFKTNLENNCHIKASAERILEEFVLIEKAGRNIYENCTDEGIFTDIEPWLLAFEQLGIAGQNVINSILAIKEEDFPSWWENYSKTKHALDEMKRISDSNNFGERRGANVATHVLTPFVKDMFEESEKLYKERFTYKDTSNYELNSITSYNNGNLNSIINDKGTKQYIQIEQINSTNIDELKGLNVTVKDDGTISYPKVNELIVEKGQYFGFELNSLIKVTNINLDFESEGNHLTLEYSVNGIEWNKYEGAPVVAKYLRVINNGEDSVSGKLKKFEINQVVNARPVVTSNATIYEGETSYLVDGNKSTYLRADEQRVGNYYLVDLGGQIQLHDVTVYMDRENFLRSGVLEVSKDGESWTILNDFSVIPLVDSFTSNLMREVNKIVSKFDSDIRKYQGTNENVAYKEVTGDAKGESYRYIRLRITGDSNYLYKVNEIEFNKYLPKESITSVSGAPGGEFSKIADERLDTAYISGKNPKDGDYLLYKRTSIKPLDSINILQNPNNISNAVVSVRVLGEGWIEVGTLDSSFNSIDISSLKNKNILDIKIEWLENGVKPFIYEITPIYNEEE